MKALSADSGAAKLPQGGNPLGLHKAEKPQEEPPGEEGPPVDEARVDLFNDTATTEIYTFVGSVRCV